MSLPTPYAAGSDLVVRFDSRTILNLVQDAGVALSILEINNNPVILAALADASSLIDSNAMVGGRYNTAQLALMTGQPANILVMLTCRLAMGGLYIRRGQTPPAWYDEANNILKLLRDGSLIFDVQGGVPSTDFSQYL